jgi:hypothetical protein
VLGLWEEIRKLATVDISLALLATLEESAAGCVEGAVQQGEEGEGIGGEDLAVDIVDLAEDGDALEDGVCACHCDGLGMWFVGFRDGKVEDERVRLRLR